MVDTTNRMQSAEDFELRSVKIYSDRYSKDFIDITSMVAEINIFEQLNSLYLTGSLTFLDDQNIFNGLNLQGTERVEIEVTLPVQEPAVIQKSFMILNVDKVIKNNDYTSTIHLNIRESRGYYNDLVKFSKAYDGSGESIISKIAEDQLKTNILNFDRNASGPTQFIRSQQKLFRYIVPYVTPMDAIQQVLSKMTTRNGMPYFCSSVLLTNDFILKDLESIIRTEPFNANRPFVYSQSASQDQLIQAFAIQRMSGSVIEDSLLAAQLGSIGLTYAMTELHSGQYIENHIDMNLVFDRLKTLGIFQDQTEFFIDGKFQPSKLLEASQSQTATDRLVDYDSKRFYQVSGSTYEEDVMNFTQEGSPSDYFLRAISFAIKQHLMRNTYTITVPGMLFLDPNFINTSVGNQIKIKVFKTTIPTDSTEASAVDEKRSGDFVILGKRHVFNCSSFKHKVLLDCGRISKSQGT
jgi:hypothetical protein